MNTMKHFFWNGQHHFLIERGKTPIGTPAGVWASYTPPVNGNPGVVMMLYATKESRFFVAHILGALALHSLKTYGELPVGSHDVSKYSIKIQRRLAPLLGQIPHDVVWNNEDFNSSIRNVAYMSDVVKAVSHDDITYHMDIGKQFVLDVLKGRVSV